MHNDSNYFIWPNMKRSTIPLSKMRTLCGCITNPCKGASDLIVNDGKGRGRERDGSNTSDELSHLFPTFHLAVTGECPQQGGHQVPWYVLLQLLKLLKVHNREGGEEEK